MAENEPTSDKQALVHVDKDAARQYGLGVLKGAIAAIPIVGTLINEALFDSRSRIQQNRINTLVNRIADHVESLTEDKIDIDYLKGEEFSDIISDVVVRTARTNSDDKRKRFAQIIAGAICGRREGRLDAVFRQLIEDLNDDDLDILRRFYPIYNISQNANKYEDWQYPMSSVLDYTQAEVFERPPVVVKTIIQNLIRMGLLFDDSHGRVSGVPYTVIMPTDLGAAFYKWIQDLPSVP